MDVNWGKTARQWPSDMAEIYREIAGEDQQWAAKMAGTRQVAHMTPSDCDASLAKLHADLGLKRLNPVWAKFEVFGGLLAVAVGLLMMTMWATRPLGEIPGSLAVCGICLFVLGGYLAMAGHRSHLYQSNNLLSAHLADEIRKHSAKV